jgi:hypothetical protein
MQHRLSEVGEGRNEGQGRVSLGFCGAVKTATETTQGVHRILVDALVTGRAACRNRTDDLFITSEPLCRLS